jgi:hypothetical protein
MPVSDNSFEEWLIERGAVLTMRVRDGDLCVDYGLGCPVCGQTDGDTHIGQTIFGYCRTHKFKWFAGCSVHYEDSEERRRNEKCAYEEIGLGDFERDGPKIKRPPEQESSRTPT